MRIETSRRGDSSQQSRPVVDKTHGQPLAGGSAGFASDELSVAGAPDVSEWFLEMPELTIESASSGNRQGGGLERRALRRLEAAPALTGRSVTLGMLLVLFVAAFTPYNDYILHNTQFIGNHFPIGIVTLMAALILLVNPMLTLFGKRTLNTGELVVIMTMMLVGATAPSSGLMRYLEPMVVSPFYNTPHYLEPIAKLMPSWLVPSKDPSSPIVIQFWTGIDPGGSIPIVKFLLPQVIWAVLIAAIFGSALFLAAIFRKQWVHHERLTFPLAAIPLELMAAPEPGRWYNRLWRNPLLWAGAAIPAFVYLLAGIHHAVPAVPYIDLHFDFHEAFTERPWDSLPMYITSAQMYFSVVGICFFVPSEIAFSLWFFLILNGVARVFFARVGIEPQAQYEATRSMGTYIGYFLGLVWLARGHLRYVIRSAWFKLPREETEPLAYRTMVVGWLACNVVAWVWLMVAGVQPLVAILLLMLGTVLVTLMARIVAESGLFFVGSMWSPSDFIGALVGPRLVSEVSYYLTSVVSRIFFWDLRETLMPYAANSMRMSVEIRPDQRGRWFRWLCVALFVSVLVSGAAHHYLNYKYGRDSIPDRWASNYAPSSAMEETYRFSRTVSETTVGASWGHFSAGLGMVGALMAGRLMWVGWPFHPIGLVLMYSGPLQQFWFAVLVGWCIKRLLLRYGGATAFRRARPFFIGLIIGEILAAGVWMFLGLITRGAISYNIFPYIT